MKARVYVTLKPTILDPQGKAIQAALRRLGYSDVEEVRVGKLIEVRLADKDRAQAGRRLEEMCEKILSNPLIENARYEFAE